MEYKEVNFTEVVRMVATRGWEQYVGDDGERLLNVLSTLRQEQEVLV